MKNFTRIVLSFSIVFFAAVSLAQANGWVANKVNQPARYTQDNKKWVVIKRGMKVPTASWIHVGPRGRLLLKRGSESILYKSNTLSGLIQRKAGRRTELRQQFGSLVVDVETRNRKHTTVKTPFLAAVVKGTKFEVTVGKNSAKLKVQRGTVEVTNPRSGERVDVRRGQTVNVNKGSRRQLRVTGPGKKAKVVRVKKSKPIVPAVAATAKAGSNAPAKSTPKQQQQSAGTDFGGKSNNTSQPRSNNSRGNSSNGNSNSGGNGNNGNGNGNGGSNNSGGNSGNGNNGNGNSNGGGNGNGNNGNGNGNGGSNNSGGNSGNGNNGNGNGGG